MNELFCVFASYVEQKVEMLMKSKVLSSFHHFVSSDTSFERLPFSSIVDPVALLLLCRIN